MEFIFFWVSLAKLLLIFDIKHWTIPYEDIKQFNNSFQQTKNEEIKGRNVLNVFVSHVE